MDFLQLSEQLLDTVLGVSPRCMWMARECLWIRLEKSLCFAQKEPKPWNQLPLWMQSRFPTSQPETTTFWSVEMTSLVSDVDFSPTMTYLLLPLAINEPYVWVPFSQQTFRKNQNEIPLVNRFEALSVHRERQAWMKRLQQHEMDYLHFKPSLLWPLAGLREEAIAKKQKAEQDELKRKQEQEAPLVALKREDSLPSAPESPSLLPHVSSTSPTSPNYVPMDPALYSPTLLPAMDPFIL